ARAWKERLDGAAGSLAGDFANVVGDFGSYGNAFTSPPFAELTGDGTRELFAGATEYSGEEGEEASYAPEAGIGISRQFGSYWWDLVAPSSFSLAFARNLSRAADSVWDAGTWTVAGKSAAVNLFGRDGAYPLGLPFDGDEYLASVRAKVSQVEGESATRYAVDSQHLALFSSGVSDRLDLENRFAASREPGKVSWSESLRASISARRERHWMLDLYRACLPGDDAAAGIDAAVPSDGAVFSTYFADLAAAMPILREGASIAGAVQRTETDEERLPATWKIEEAYEAKLTLPQKLTATLSASLSQAWGGGKAFTLSTGLGLKVVASF
ncbi:MAG: hypothetical protein Q8M76_18930, partial [Spirochaetaceae bacterium]|nr:hypothetical protein [Spirochaetaceae bacterium]